MTGFDGSRGHNLSNEAYRVRTETEVDRMSGQQVNVNDTGYTQWNHYERGEVVGATVRCDDCKTIKDFVSIRPLHSWLQLHATPGLFACKEITA